MESEDLYPADGEYFIAREPAEQAVSRKKEKAQTLEALSTLRTVTQHLEEHIALLGSVDGIPKAVKSDPEKFLRIHNANELARDILRSEKEYIESLIDTAGQ